MVVDGQGIFLKTTLVPASLTEEFPVDKILERSHLTTGQAGGLKL